MSTLRGVLCVLVVLPFWAVADSPLRIPDLPSADMQISWDDFKELLELIQDEKPAAAVQKPKKPPVPWSLLEANYTADATETGFVAIDAAITFQVWSEDWEQIPVLGTGAALESATLDGEPCFLAEKAGAYTLMLDAPGAHVLSLRFHIEAKAVEGVVRFEAPVRPTPVTRMTLRLDEPKAVVRAPMAAGSTVRSVDAGQEVDLVFRSTDTLAVEWQLPAAPAPVPEEKPRVAPRVTCLTTTLATVSENFVSFESALQFEVLRGEVNAFALALPADYQVLGVDGTGLGYEVETTDDTQQITVALNHVITDRYAFTLRYEAPIDTETTALDLPPLVVDEVLRHHGYIAVASSGNVELGTEPQLEDIQRVDVTDLPTTLVQRSFHPILHGFQYQAPEYLLALDFHRLAHVPVRVAGIDDAKLTTVRTEAGMTINKIAYTVRNHHKKFLRVEIGADARVWSAQVAGEVVRPARNDDAGAVLIPLRKSATRATDGGGFAVELVYATEGTPAKGWWQDFAFEAPRPDLLANRFSWEVWVPTGRAVYRSGGDLEASEGAENPLSLLSAAARPAAAYREETIYRMREGIERFFITDINNPAASARMLSGHETAYDGKQDPALMQEQGDVQVAGVVPIAMEVPVSGRVYRFQRTVVPEDTPLSLKLETVDRRILGGIAALLRTGGLLVGLLVAWGLLYRLGERRVRRIEVLAVGILGLVFLGALSYGEMAILAYLRWPLAGLGIGAALGVGHYLLRHPELLRGRSKASTAGVQS